MGSFFGFPPLKSSRPLDGIIRAARVEGIPSPQLVRKTVNRFGISDGLYNHMGRPGYISFTFPSVDILQHNTLDPVGRQLERRCSCNVLLAVWKIKHLAKTANSSLTWVAAITVLRIVATLAFIKLIRRIIGKPAGKVSCGEVLSLLLAARCLGSYGTTLSQAHTCQWSDEMLTLLVKGCYI